MEKVSVIIPTYNRASKLMKSIESVLNQTYSNIELVVVDDGSTDNTQELVESINDERINYIKLPHNRGASGARNAGVEYSKGKIIAFEDSDDLWKKEKLEKQMSYWKEHPEFSMIYCQYNMHVSGEVCNVPDKDWYGEFEGDIFPWLLLRNTVGAPTMLMYKESFLKVGGFDTTLRSLEDWDFAVRFAEKYMIGYVEKPLVDAFFSEGGVSSGTAAYYESRCKMIARNKKQMMEYGVFDLAVTDLFQRAEQRNMLENVKKMLMLFLTKT